MKKPFCQSAKNSLLLSLCVLCLLALSACQTAQDSTVDTPVGGNESAAAAPAETDNAEEPQARSVDYITSFPNRDGSVTINIDLPYFEYPNVPLPTVQVTPYSFTAEDAKRVAEALFGDAALYERSREVTREEVEYWISRYEHALREEVLYEEYGYNEDAMELVRQERQKMLDYYRSLYDSTQPRQPCQWTFYPISHYLPEPGSELDFPTGYHYLSDEDSVVRFGDNILTIAALAECPDGRTYSYQVLNTETEERNEHVIFAYLESYVDSSMVREPTAEDLESIQRKAEALLAEMGLGQFMIDKVHTVQYADGVTDGFAVSVSTVPVYSGLPALHQTKLAGPSFANDSVRAPKYDPQQIGFHFTADGVLLDFKYESPLALVEVVDEETPIIDWETARESIEQCLRLDKEPFSVNVDVNVNEIAFGLARVYIADNTTDFQLVPALILRGHRVICDEDGNVDYTAGMAKTRRYFFHDGLTYGEGYESDLITVSLIDGSVLVQKAFSAQDIENRY